MWTIFRAKRCPAGFFLVAVATLWLEVGCATPSANLGSLYTPVKARQAVGPLPDPPVPYYPYQPRKIVSLGELPAGIQAKAKTELTARVGEEFLRRLHFAGGEIVDLDELHRVNPASRRFSPAVPTYLLRFDFSSPEVGIRRYTVSLVMRRDGSLLRGIDVPAVGTEPAKLGLKPLPEVSAEMARRGLIDPATTTATVTYDRARDALVWHFEQTLPGSGPEVKTRVVDVDARSGNIVRPSEPR